jgi:CheY-like chemotaxis protein
MPKALGLPSWSAADNAPHNILLVEDHDQTGKIMSRLLSNFGYEVEWAQSVDSALRAAARRKFDLVVSDLGLPDGSGHDLMVELQRHYGLKGVAISGYGMEQDLDRSARSGFSRHLTKPVTIEKLDAAIKDVFTAVPAAQRAQ